ncbi:MAG: transglutaminase domain-containing protein [Spirochaetes bacterium]|nr:transglutaminase domain-containing protein [Spirochaetota bacterium]MBN2772384.1 transglutaminase domain-containing protein [Spirochaetota bacterium]
MKRTIYADYDNILVKETAERLTQNQNSIREKVENIFYYVRDEIKFSFPLKGDLVKASETIKNKKGQCNTKSALFLALCKAAAIPAKIHFSLIKKEIQKGLFTGFMYRLMPNFISHSWVEVDIEGTWRKIDSFINDESFYRAGRAKLKENKMDTGYSISCSSGESSISFNPDEEKFVQMDAVTDDHGLWYEPYDYYASHLYKNRPGIIKLIIYRIMIPRINKRVNQMRNKCQNGLC